jgi:DNA-binding transcriptional ArsR family regulator
MNSRSHIANVVNELLAERVHLASRLEKVDALIAGVRDVFHLPAPPRVNGKHPVATKPKLASNGNGHDGRISDELVRVALQNGPLSPGELAARLGVERSRLRFHIEKMQERGLITASGSTSQRRVALPEAPAKEAP